jgi:response regulator NasT
MAIKIECRCGKVLLAADSAAGRKGRCPVCGREITVPLPQPVAPVGQEEPSPAKEEFPESRPRVLIADTSRSHQEALTKAFEEHGYTVIHATSNGEEVVEKVRELKPDVAVVDVKLEGLSGFRAIKTLTDPLNPRNKDVPGTLFVMTTDDLHGRDKQYALSLGVEIFIEKPCAPARVFPRIERRLKRRRPRR